MANPEIPSFKNPQGEPPKDGGAPIPKMEGGDAPKEEKKSGVPLFGRSAAAPKAPGFSAAGSPATTPSLKIRGLAGGPKTLLERLKQFQKKDLVFITSGMGVLFLAPLAEHFMMSPSQDGNMKPGFSQPGSSSMFGGELGVHEPGTGGMSPGGLYGNSTDVITPLNVRDPSALVMAPGASQVQVPPAASTVAPPAASSARDSGGWKDALSAAKSGAEKGADAAKPGAFKAPGNLAGALRGLSALSGGSYGGGPTYALGAPNASNVPNRPGDSSRLSQVKSAAGYRGVGARGMDSGGGIENMKKGAGDQAGLFNRPGSAANSLEAAAREAIPLGGGSGGSGPGSGGENKGGAGGTSKDNKALGESLAYLKMKMEMEKEMDLKWSKKKWKEFEFPKMIYEELTKSAIQNIVGKGMFEPMGKLLSGVWAGAAGNTTSIKCWRTKTPEGAPFQTYTDNPPDEVYQLRNDSSGYVVSRCKDGNPPTGCSPVPDLPPGGSFGFCYSEGGAPSTGGGGGSRENGQPQTGAPGQVDRERQSQETSRDIESGRGKVTEMLSRCPANGVNPTPDQIPIAKLCETARALEKTYEKGTGHLDQANTSFTESGKKYDSAWARMNDAAKAMKESVDRAFAAANTLGCQAQGGSRTCVKDQTLLDHATKAQKALEEAVTNADLAAADPTKADLAIAKYNEARLALEEAKKISAGALWETDKRLGISGHLNAAVADLQSATTLAREGGKNIKLAEGALATANAVQHNTQQETQKAQQEYIGPASQRKEVLKAELIKLAGASGGDGSGNEPIITDGASLIGKADAVRLGALDKVKVATCGECKQGGMAPDPGPHMMRAVIDVARTSQALTNVVPQEVTATGVPGATEAKAQAVKVLGGGSFAEQVTRLPSPQIKALDDAMAAVDKTKGQGQGQGPAQDVNVMIACTQAKVCP